MAALAGLLLKHAANGKELEERERERETCMGLLLHVSVQMR